MDDRAGSVPATGEVIDTTKLCGSFPEVFGVEILRDNVLHTLETFFEGETQLLIVEGPDRHQGIGKTILLAQFARRSPDRSLSVFIRPTSWFAYDPSIVLRDLCNQMNWILFREELRTTSEVDDGFLAGLIFELQRYARRSQRSIVFVVDGITEVPKDRLQVRDAILSKLPFGFPQFRFLFSGPSKDVLKLKTPKLIHKTFTLSPFSLEETVSYFGDTMSRDMIVEVFKVSHGVPGYLSRIRRIMESGIPAATLLEQLPTTDPELFEIEWRGVEEANQSVLEIIALLAHDRNKHTGEELANIFRIDAAEIGRLLEKFTFLDVPSTPFKEVEFVSDTYRLYATQRLASYKDRVNELIIDWLLREPDSEQSLSLLPVYFRDAGRDEALLSYLSSEHLGRMLERSGVVTPVQERTRMGVETALRLRRDEDLTRLGVQSSVIAALDGFSISRSEVEARLALQDVESCIALAQASVLKEDRIRLLALIARKLREKGQLPEPEILDQIEQLAKEVDFTTFNAEKAVEFAEDLMYSRPELAMIVLEKAGGRKAGAQTQTSLDWALASLSVAAMLSEERDLKSAAETITRKIIDPDVVSFSTAASALFGGYTASDVIAEVERIRSPVRKLALLRQWALHARNEPDVAVIIEYAITLGIKTTEYSPNATHLRELATPLPYLRDSQSARNLISSFDTQRATVEGLGPTEDYVRLQLILAEAESRVDQEAASKRLEETYLYISYITDISIKTAGIAALTATLSKIDPTRSLEDKNKLHSVAEVELDNDLAQLLSATAQHNIATRRVIEALATARSEKALKVCLSLNVETRRDNAIHTLVKNLLRQPVKQIDFTFLHRVLDAFGNPADRDQAVTGIIERLGSLTNDDALNKFVGPALPLLARSMSIASAELRVRGTCLALQVVKRTRPPGSEALEKAVEATMTKAWESMDDDWRRVEAAFSITSTMATCCRDLALKYLEAAESLRDSVFLENPMLHYGLAMRLVVRSYSGLLSAKIESKEEFEDLSNRVNRFPSLTSRLGLWADLALRSLSHSRLGEAKRLVDEKLQPLLTELEQKDREEWCAYIHLCSPALYASHPKSTLTMIASLPEHWRDLVRAEIIEFICRKVPSTDPYMATGEQVYSLRYDDITEIIDVLETLTSDARLYQYICSIVDAARKQRPTLSQQQKAAIVQRLGTIIKASLPSRRGIQHSGWSVVCEAELLRLQRDQPHEWERLITELGGIPNTTDRAFATSLVARAMWSSNPVRSEQLFREAVRIAETIPSIFHRVDALDDIARNASMASPEFAKLCLTRAIEIASGQRDADIADVQRNIVDLANLLSPEFGSTLAAMIDADPARKGSAEKAKDQLELDELRKKMLDESVSAQGLFLADEDKIVEGAWRNLGALNAHRVETVHVRHAREYMMQASKMPIDKAYSVFSWAIENTNVRMQRATDDQASVLRGTFRATIQGCDLSSWVGMKMCGRHQRGQQRAGAEHHVMRAGEREKAVSRLRDWIEVSGSEYLKICDPFVGPDELVDILRIVLGSKATLRVNVVTSRKYQAMEKVSVPWEDAYRLRWRLASDQEPPDTRIVIAGLPSGDSPLHDRWWITKSSGLRLGTSFNSIGTNKGAEITNISEDHLVEFEAEIDACLNLAMRGKDGEKITYSSFSL